MIMIVRRVQESFRLEFHWISPYMRNEGAGNDLVGGVVEPPKLLLSGNLTRLAMIHCNSVAVVSSQH
ncbi:hypothetical protein Leryth_000253 [Lithospermum erythrorhizon]|nr:hypothetical protein Leryth_000253 [Lithospermum erythrorhizon]